MDYTIVPPKKEDLTSKGFTNRIKINKDLSAEDLQSYGFTNHDVPTLYFCCMVGEDVSFNLSVNKFTLDIVSIDVLDEDFFQAYDYQSILMKDSSNSFARGVFNKVDKVLNDLQKDGIIYGYERGMYV